MVEIAKIDNASYTNEDLVTYLKLNNEYDELIDKFLRHKVAVMAAQKRDVSVSGDEVQQGADDFRRLLGLHRAKETMDWLENQKLTLDDLELFLTEQLSKRKVCDLVTSDDKIEEYFKLNSPKFDEVSIKTIVVDSTAKANELIAGLEDDPSMFDEFAQTHSLDDETKSTGGLIPNVRRGTLPEELEAKIFNTDVGAVVGPFQMDNEELYQIIKVSDFKTAQLDDTVKSEIGELLWEEWQNARMEDYQIAAD